MQVGSGALAAPIETRQDGCVSLKSPPGLAAAQRLPVLAPRHHKATESFLKQLLIDLAAVLPLSGLLRPGAHHIQVSAHLHILGRFQCAIQAQSEAGSATPDGCSDRLQVAILPRRGCTECQGACWHRCCSLHNHGLVMQVVE